MNINTPFGYWVRVAPYTGFKVGKYSRPAFVGNRPTPENLNKLTIGQLIDLSGLSDTNGSLYAIVKTILDMDRAEADKARAVDVVRFVGWVSGEVEKINKIFDKVSPERPTMIEKRAGIDKLKFGLFGMLDWYALRMGIGNHDEVLNTPWLRIYKCMDMDSKRRAYDRRLQKLQADEIKMNSRIKH